MRRPAAPPELSRLAPAAARLFEAYPVRKGARRKAAFREALRAELAALGWAVTVEESGSLVKNHNVVAGQPGARLQFTAHYDTPARLPFPNFLAPRNLPVSLAYQLFLMLVIGVLVFIPVFGVAWLSGGQLLPGLLAGMALAYGVIGLMLCGPANPHNANDNTSGVLTLLQIAAALPPEARAEVALVFFDNEELGLLGSGQYRKKHPERKDGMLLNFDCVGEGDTLLFVPRGALRKDAAAMAALAAAFPPGEAKTALLDTWPLTIYPSDQMMFSRGVGVVALRRAPLLGRYLSRIHTARDTVLQQENILWLAEASLRLVRNAGSIHESTVNARPEP